MHRRASWILLTWAAFAVHGQDPAIAEYTFTRTHTLHRQVELPGTTASRYVSLVASEADGLVTELLKREGQKVDADEIIATMREVPTKLQLDSMQAQLKEAQARRNLSRISLERANELFESEVLSQQQLDESSYEFQAWVGRVERLKADIGLLEDTLANLSVHAPFDGVITDESVQRGEWVDQGDPVVELASVDRLEVIVAVPEKYYANLELGTQAKIRLDGLSGREFSGKIAAINPRADLRARTFKVKIGLEPGPGLGIGMLARVSIPVGDAYEGLILPKDALVDQGGQIVVYRIGEGDRVEVVPVRVGLGDGQWVAVDGDLKTDERVVVRGNERLRPQQSVIPREFEVAPP